MKTVEAEWRALSELLGGGNKEGSARLRLYCAEMLEWDYDSEEAEMFGVVLSDDDRHLLLATLSLFYEIVCAYERVDEQKLRLPLACVLMHCHLLGEYVSVGLRHAYDTFSLDRFLPYGDFLEAILCLSWVYSAQLFRICNDEAGVVAQRRDALVRIMDRNAVTAAAAAPRGGVKRKVSNLVLEDQVFTRRSLVCDEEFE